jgi:uncharacterized membrane protein
MFAHRIPASSGPTSPGAAPLSDRAGEGFSPATPSGRPVQRRVSGFGSRLRPSAFKPLTYSAMHLCVAIAVAYALTRDWRIALGVGVIEPMVQTVAYMAHEKAWSLGRAKTQAQV